MGTYIDIDGDPNEVSATGAMLRSLAESFSAKIKSIQSDIGAIEGERPWGNDKYGHAFETTYNATPEGGSQPFSQTVKDGMSNAGELLSTAADRTIRAMNAYLGADAEGATEIKRSAH